MIRSPMDRQTDDKRYQCSIIDADRGDTYTANLSVVINTAFSRVILPAVL